MSSYASLEPEWCPADKAQPAPEQHITVVLKEAPDKAYDAIFLPNHGRSHRILFKTAVPRRRSYGGNYRFWWQVKAWRATAAVGKSAKKAA
jgi:hypothetical protein